MTQLFKQDYGNLVCVETDAEREPQHRAAGFKTLEELFPPVIGIVDVEIATAAAKPRKGRK